MARKPGPESTGKTETILARVSPETRGALELAAKQAKPRPHSLSREIEERLTESLTFEGAQGATKVNATDSLLWGVRMLIQHAEYLTGKEWTADGFTRDVVADGAQWFVRHLGPKVDGAPPPPTFPAWVPEAFDPPFRRDLGEQLIKRGLGKLCARAVIDAMALPLPSGEVGKRLAEHFSMPRVAAKGLRGLIRLDLAEKDES